MIKNPEANTDELLAFFFKLYAKWDWSNPVSLIDQQQA
jgi:poly(A) polymerase Pap1